MKMNRSYAMARSQGLTLVELMLAMALSLLLAAGAFTIFSATKSASVTQQDLARMQENLRFAMTEMINRISLAGYMGCTKSTDAGNPNVTSTVPVRTGANIKQWAPDLTVPISGTDGAAGAPDTLTLVYADPLFPARIEPMLDQSAPLKVWLNYTYRNLARTNKIQKKSLLVVSDCEYAAVFRLSNNVPWTQVLAPAGSPLPVGLATFNHAIGGGWRNTSTDLGHIFGRSGEVAWVRSLKIARFFLKTKTVNGKTVSSLMVRRNQQKLGQADELVEGVEDFQVEYGIDDAPFDGSADRYVPWSSSLPSRRISSVRVTLTINGGRPVADADGRADQNVDVKRDVVFTVKLRNQVGDFL